MPRCHFLIQILQECHAVIYVVDTSDRERIPESKQAFLKMIHNENVRGVPLLVAANKQGNGTLYLGNTLRSNCALFFNVTDPYIAESAFSYCFGFVAHVQKVR
jgi:hypothetical protein